MLSDIDCAYCQRMSKPSDEPAPAAILTEAERLAVLRDYDIMDTPPSPALDHVTHLVSQTLGVPTALVSLLDEQRQWFKSRVGLAVDHTAREIAFCDHVVRSGEILVVPDATRDERFSHNPLVADAPHIRFYAGIPLRVPEGAVLGTLCAIDYVARELSPEQLKTLSELAALATEELVAHRRDRSLVAARSDLQLYRRFFEGSRELNCVASIDGRFLAINDCWTELLGHSREALLREPFFSFVHPEDVEATAAAMARLGSAESVVRFRNRYRCRDGTYRWLEWTAHPTGRPDEAVYGSARDVSEVVAQEQVIAFRDGLLSLITDAQARFITEGADASWWNFVLERMLLLTGSEYGFIGMVETDASGVYLRTKSITNIAWSDETRRFYDTHAPQGMIFRNLNTLFGRALVTKERYVANDVAHDPHAGGRPDGHPPLNAFAGLPIKDGLQMVGLVGLANRPHGYDDDVVNGLEPLLAFLAKVLNVLQLQAQQESFVARLESSRELQERVLEASETGFLALSDDGRVVLANRRAREMLPSLHSFGDTDAPGLERALMRLFSDDDVVWTMSMQNTPTESVRGPRKVKVRDAAGPDGVAELTVTRFREEPARSPGLLLALADVRQRAALEDTMRRNVSLEERVNQLRQQQRDNEIISECVEYLQRCTNLDEGMELIGRSLERLFPQANVSLYVARETSGLMVLRREMRRFGDQSPASELLPSQCWALRTRRTYGSWPGGHHLPCQHGATHADCPVFCVPLFTLESNVAIFSVVFPADDARTHDALEARMSQFVAMAQSISGALSTIALRESLQRLAMLDELTELSNRRAFQLEVGRNTARLRRQQKPYALAILDVDHFKSVNDKYGHDVGDRVLRRVADVLKRCVRESDLVARVGGEEFAIFFTDIAPDIAAQRIDNLLKTLRTTTDGDIPRVTASVGLAHSSDFGAASEYETMYKAADVALYRAKTEGRDRAVTACPPGEIAAAALAEVKTANVLSSS